MTIFPPVGPVLGPRHYSHPRDGAQMLSKGPQRKTRVRTDLYTQKVKFCNFCCFLTTFDLDLEKAAIPWLCVQLQSFEEAEVHPVHQVDPGVQRWGRWARHFLYFLHRFLYIFLYIFLYCFLIAFFVLFFCISFFGLLFLTLLFFIAFFVLLSLVKVREQFNGITAFLDMSAIYASDEKWQKAMRQTEFHVKTCLCESKRCIKKRLSRRCPGTLKVILKK